MANINVEVDLGTVGSDISGYTVSISGCTGGSCGSGCSSLSPSQFNVNDFPQVISIPDTTLSLFVMVDSGPCSGTTQCISVNIVTPTPTVTITPTSTITPTVTITPTITPTVEDVITPTPTITPTVTITPTKTITPTITPTSTITPTVEETLGTCYTYTYSSVPSDLYVRYRRVSDDTVVDTLINSLIQIDNGDGTYSAAICVSNISPYNIPVCVQGGLEVTCPSNWQSGGLCSNDSVCLIGGDPTPTPTITPTVTPPIVYTFYRATEVLESNTSTTYCLNFGSGGQGYVMSQPFYTTDSVLTPGTTVIYSDSDLTTIDSGSWESVTNETLIAYITQSEYEIISYRTTTDPDGDGTYSGGPFKYIRVDSSGIVQDSGTYSCNGGSTPV